MDKENLFQVSEGFPEPKSTPIALTFYNVHPINLLQILTQLLLLLTVQTYAEQRAEPLLRVQIRKPDIRVHLQHFFG